jgi:hypothetical protein
MAIESYRGWAITWNYGYYTAISPNYDASWEGDEDGWVDNGEKCSERTLEDLYASIDERILELEELIQERGRQVGRTAET